MKTEALSYDVATGRWSSDLPSALDSARTLVLAFGASEIADNPAPIASLARAFPRSVVVGCSSAGEVHGATVRDRSISVTVSRFDRSDLAFASIAVRGPSDSFSAGDALARKLLAARPALRAVIVFSEGLLVNGSELVRGLNGVLDPKIVVTGGLSADGSAFKRTWVSIGEKVQSNVVVAIGLYGDSLMVGHGSKGGWDRFGPERIVTRSEGNVLYELDGKPALALYKEYLGDKAKDLPASGLLFPLAMRQSSKDEKFLVRTLLSVDHERQSMSFAGDVPKGYLAQLMRADFDKLIDGAASAGRTAAGAKPESSGDSLAIAISCVGRRLVLGERTDEEVEAVLETLPSRGTTLTGFYSYGEISPYGTGHCDLHNQTMTLTVIREAEAVAVRPAEDRARPSVTAFGRLRGGESPALAKPSSPSAGLVVERFSYGLDEKAWSVRPFPALDSPRTMVLAFGAPEVFDHPEALVELAKAYPRSIVFGCSGAGEVHDTQVRDRSIAVTVTRFAETDLSFASFDVSGPADSATAGETVGRKLAAARPGLRAVLVLSEGLNVNGSELVRGLKTALDPKVVVTGGLAGDGARFARTWVAIGGKLKQNVVAAIGFYGDAVNVTHGSKGGWDRFGPERVVTRSEGNVVYEIDGKPALALYKEYLGDKANELPGSGLLFPLSIRASAKDEKRLVRTLLAVDHTRQSLTFAGDIPTGTLAQLMKADFEKLIGGAGIASETAKVGVSDSDCLVVAISCVGRRLVLGDRTEEEVEAVKSALPNGGARAHVTGFYSYGEISPYTTGHCDLHNQTMTLTIVSESKSIDKKVEPKRPILRPADRTMETLALSPKPATALQVRRLAYTFDDGKWSAPFPKDDSKRTLVLAFGDTRLLDDPKPLASLAAAYPSSIVLGCSSAGEIHGTTVRDGSLSVTVTRFSNTDLGLASFEVHSAEDSRPVGRALAKQLSEAKPGLRAVLVLSDGLGVNGSDLVRGINDVLDSSIVVTGGLAGDGSRFSRTWVAVGGRVARNVVAAVGFYGDHVVIGHGSKGGWDRFGPERVITRSEGNVLYEIDGKPALALYKEYLGEKAKELPASGLLFPLSMRASSKDDKFLVRTVLSVDHERNSMTFAGDVPKGHLVQLMKADFDKLVGGASLAGAAVRGLDDEPASLTIAISCVGRRLVLGDRTEEEVEAVRDALPDHGAKTELTGFYSYGEISPYATGHCDLHNQTMTLTVIGESAIALERGESVDEATKLRPSRPGMSAVSPPRAPSPPPVSQPPASHGPVSVTALSAPQSHAATPPPVQVASNGSPPARENASRPKVDPTKIPVVTRATANASTTSQATVNVESFGSVSVLTLRGRLSETFKGDSVGASLSGNVVVDLADVERITSYGVREWLAMLAAAKNVQNLVFARCSEAVVNQLGMIRKFAGPARVVSFFAPYLCGTCGEPFERLFDVERDREAILEASPPSAPCPSCAALGRFDDDPETYFAFAQAHAGEPVGADIREALARLVEPKPEGRKDPVEKSVEGSVTRVRLQTKLTADIRWPRILDGIEGPLVLDLGVPGAPDGEAVRVLERALLGIGSEVPTISLERCPEAVLARASALLAKPGLSIASAVFDGHCAACGVPRPAQVSMAEHGEAIRAGRTPLVPCKRCNGDLTIPRSDLLAALLPVAKPRQESGAHSISPESAPTSVASMSAPARPKVGLRPEVLLGGAALLFGVLALGGVAFRSVMGAAPTPQPASTVETTRPEASGAAPRVDVDTNGLPPAWTERAFALDGETVALVGRTERGSSGETAVKRAREDAVVRLVQEVAKELTGSPIHDFVKSRSHGESTAMDAAVAARFLAQCGAFATPERVDAWLPSGREGAVRFRLDLRAYQKVLAFYRETATVQGMAVARFFPALERSFHSDGELVVLSTQKGRMAEGVGLRAGDVVLSVDGRGVAAPETFSRAMNDGWAQVPVRGALAVEVESAGARRTIRFYKPAPQAP